MGGDASVGQVFLLHCKAWMQPSANIKPRAEVTKSAPAHKAQATSVGFMRLCRLWFINTFSTTGKASLSGKPTLSISDMGAAPVPPSPPSRVIKSGADSSPRSLISAHSLFSQSHQLATVLKPTGLPVTVLIRADGIFTLWDVANLGNFFGDFYLRKYAAFTGFCSLAEFKLKHFYLLVRGDLF